MAGNKSDDGTVRPDQTESGCFPQDRRRLAAFLVLLGLLTFILSACAGHVIRSESTKGVYHQVKKGETLWGIARAYHVNLQELAELNNITNNAIEAGDAVFIPGAMQIIENTSVAEKQKAQKKQPPLSNTATAVPPAKKIKKPATVSGKEQVTIAKATPDKTHDPDDLQDQPEKSSDIQPTIVMDKKRFIWPIQGTILSRYGIQPNGLKNNGIKIGARENTPVQAASDGEVTYSDTLKYYGDTIILKHDNDFSTVYSSLKGRTVKVGDRVKKGETIAQVGKVDNNGEICLNFEVRQKNKPRNPLFFLP